MVPGMGGFKRESEVGVALHTGHPVYFVVFFPEPCPHQTLADVLAALRRFVEACRGSPWRQAAGALWQLPGGLGGNAPIGALRRASPGQRS